MRAGIFLFGLWRKGGFSFEPSLLPNLLWGDTLLISASSGKACILWSLAREALTSRNSLSVSVLWRSPYQSKSKSHGAERLRRRENARLEQVQRVLHDSSPHASTCLERSSLSCCSSLDSWWSLVASERIMGVYQKNRETFQRPPGRWEIDQSTHRLEVSVNIHARIWQYTLARHKS